MIQTGSKELIRDINTQLILKTLIEEGAASRASLAERLHLTKATISAIVQILLEKGLVREIGSRDDAPRGRKPILLEIERNCAYIISVDLGTDTATFLTANLMGDIVFCKTVESHETAETILTFLIRHIAMAKDAIPSCRYGLAGISVGIHGIVHKNHVVFVPYSSYQDIDFKGILETTFLVPVMIDNEANLSVLGEWAFCYHSPNMLSISVHSGIGLGIIIENRLITGQNGFAGEFGHTILEMDGRPCPCGNRGCLEQYASARVLLREFSEIKGKAASAEDLFLAYKENDSDAIHIVNRFVRYMTVSISNLLTIFNPDIIVLNSTFTNHLPELAKQIQGNLKNRMSPYCRLLLSSLKDQAILLGGVHRCSYMFLGLTESGR